MTTAEDELWELRQGGWGLERYVEEFLELSNRVSWHDASLGTCFHLGLNDKTIRCELPTGSYPLIELINLVLFLNGSDREVETELKSCHPAPAGTRSASPAHPMPRTSAYLSNCSPHLPDSEDSPSSPLVPSSSSLSPLVLPSSSSLAPPSSSSSPLVPFQFRATRAPPGTPGLVSGLWGDGLEPSPRACSSPAPSGACSSPAPSGAFSSQVLSSSSAGPAQLVFVSTGSVQFRATRAPPGTPGLVSGLWGDGLEPSPRACSSPAPSGACSSPAPPGACSSPAPSSACSSPAPSGAYFSSAPSSADSSQVLSSCSAGPAQLIFVAAGSVQLSRAPTRVRAARAPTSVRAARVPTRVSASRVPPRLACCASRAPQRLSTTRVPTRVSASRAPFASAGPVQLTFASAGPVRLAFASAGPVRLAFASAGSVQLTFASAGPVQLTLASAGPVQLAFCASRAPPRLSATRAPTRVRGDAKKSKYWENRF